MRVTNKMMTNNSLSNINKNKNIMSKLDQQYSSEKKIQKPSDDPIVAVRALKLRMNLSQIEQYYSRNIPDAASWMNVTEGALKTVDSVLSQMNEKCNQGANDPSNDNYESRKKIVADLKEMAVNIYEEGDANFAGRYVFSGYKTDTSLIFTENTTNLHYDINQKFSGSDIEKITRVTGEYELKDYIPGTSTVNDFKNAPALSESYRIQLSYTGLDNVQGANAAATQDALNKMIRIDDGTGTLQDIKTALGIDVKAVTSTDKNAYNVGDNAGQDKIHFIADTGEIIFSKDVYDTIRLKENGEIQVDYKKSKFDKNDLRPEHYFDCTMTDTDKPEKGTITYTQPGGGQKIDYEVSFNQKLTINTEGKDAITHDINLFVKGLETAVNDLEDVSNKLEEVQKMIDSLDPSATGYAGQLEVLNQFAGQLETEKTLKEDVVKKAFERGITITQKAQDRSGVAVADLGSRMKRLELTESRLGDQRDDVTELKSENEDADLVETYIKMTSAENVYNASLSSAAKIVKNSLLDFL